MGIFHFSQIMANPSCGRFANPPTSQNFQKRRRNQTLIPSCIIFFSLLHHLCKSYNHKKKHLHLPHQHDAIDGDHLFMSIIKEEGNHPFEERRRRRRRTRSFSPKSLYILSFSLSFSHKIHPPSHCSKQIVAFVVVHPLLECVLSAPLLDSQVFSIPSHTLHSCFCSQHSQPLLYLLLLLHLHLL